MNKRHNFNVKKPDWQKAELPEREFTCLQERPLAQQHNRK